MKTIIYNHDNLQDEEINRYVYRAKALMINLKGEILLGFSNNNYHLPGGHLEKDETIEECLVREVKEETGIDIRNKEKFLFMRIIYMNKDYPIKGINTKSIANYYYINCDNDIDLKNISLTDDEINSNFKLKYIHKDNVLDILNKSLKNSTRYGAVKDTIDVIDEFLNSSKDYYFYRK